MAKRKNWDHESFVSLSSVWNPTINGEFRVKKREKELRSRALRQPQFCLTSNDQGWIYFNKIKGAKRKKWDRESLVSLSSVWNQMIKVEYMKKAAKRKNWDHESLVRRWTPLWTLQGTTTHRIKKELAICQSLLCLDLVTTTHRIKKSFQYVNPDYVWNW